jgi:polysaccharide biosynthesis transport protein
MTDSFDNEQATQRGLEDYWGLAKRRRWWIMGIAFAGWAMAIFAGHMIPPKYKSETVILVDQPKVPSQYVTPNVSVDLQSQLQSLTQQILSRTRLLKIIDDYNLYPNARMASEDAAVETMRHNIGIEEIKSPGRPLELSAFKISYMAQNAKLAQEVTGRLSSFFIEDNLRNQQQLSEDTTNFLESQLEDARKDLEKQERELEQFRSAYLGQLPEQTQGNMQILAGLQARLDGATEALNHAEQQKLYFESLLAQYRVPRSSAAITGGATVAPTAQSLAQRIQALQTELAAAEAKYTPQYPDVIRLKKQLADLESLQRKIDQQPAPQKQNDEAAASAASQADPAVTQLQGEARANALEINNRRKEVQDLERQIEQYQARLNLAPVREQQLAALTRNYNQSRTNYESLLAKKMQSQMATNLEKRQEGAQFRVLDPPGLPQKPFSPNRMMVAVIGLGGGLVFGTIISLLIELLNAKIYGERDLKEITDAAILATVPPLPTPGELRVRSSKRVLEFVLAGLMLVTVPAVTLLTYLKG